MNEITTYEFNRMKRKVATEVEDLNIINQKIMATEKVLDRMNIVRERNQ